MKILVVEDQTIVRELLMRACAEAVAGAQMRGAGTGKAALAECRREPPDLVMLDLVLPDGDGLELLGDVFAAAPAAKVIVLSSHIDEFTLSRAFKSRVHGIIDKNEQPVRILGEAIATVLGGGQYVSSTVAQLRASLRADPSAFDKILTDREQEVLQLIGRGVSNEGVAEALGISVSTARHHRINIMEKLDIHSTPQLIRYAIEKGFSRVNLRTDRGAN